MSSLIHEGFCCCYRIMIEATYPCSKGVHETIKLSIWEGAVDPSIAFRSVSVSHGETMLRQAQTQLTARCRAEAARASFEGKWL